MVICWGVRIPATTSSREGEIDEKTVLMRMEPQKLDELLHPVFDKAALKRAKVSVRQRPMP